MVGPAFEGEVRGVARALWNLPVGEGAAEFINNEEIDCVCRTEELIHLIECSTDSRMEKYRQQVTKLISAKQFLERAGETVKLRIVSSDEPTPLQRSHAKGQGIIALSLQEFRRGLLDSRQYLESRWEIRFGSATDPEDGSYALSDDEYVEQPLTAFDSDTTFSVRDICCLLGQGKTVVLTGPFGAGKSLTIREVFRNLRRDFYRSNAVLTPIAINLRDHWGQPRVDEVLRRHAHIIGFDKPEQLVRAWNAGQLLPLLDGFDELASPVMPMTRDAIRRSREEALKVIQAFMTDLRGRSGVLIAGRDHYFDSIDEARKLLRLPEGTIFIEVGEFSEEQAIEYLRKRKITSELPSWLPRKPLLLGYCASKELLEEVVGIQGDAGVAHAWDQFLHRICEREADSSQVVTGEAIRRLLEDLATRARALPRGSGPLLDSDLSDAYRKVTGNEPLEAARAMLQRLPGLTARDQEVGARSFVDDEMLEALQAGAVARFIKEPFVDCEPRGTINPLTDFGCSVARHLAEKSGVKSGQFWVAANQAIRRWSDPTVALDSILAGASAWGDGAFDAQGLTVVGGLADVIDLEEHPTVNLSLHECMINRLRYEGGGSEISLSRCQILKLEGVSSAHSLPEMFQQCEIDEFDDRETNAAIVRSTLQDPMKVFLVLIRKLFLQRGSGRVDSALSRGVDTSLQSFVVPIRDLLVSKGIVYSHVANGRLIWHGNRTHRSRMLRILERPISSDDPLMREVAELSNH